MTAKEFLKSKGVEWSGKTFYNQVLTFMEEYRALGQDLPDFDKLAKSKHLGWIDGNQVFLRDYKTGGVLKYHILMQNVDADRILTYRLNKANEFIFEGFAISSVQIEKDSFPSVKEAYEFWVNWKNQFLANG